MQKTKEELAKEAGMLKSLTTKIIDNLQVTINNVHVRVENEDLEDDKATFSLGITLQSLLFNTTDQKWNKMFIDRTLPEN
jgi:vacuolar protein sorting-associated protein 13A/C